MRIRESYGVVCKIVGGGTPSRKVSDYWGGGIPWATVKDLGSDRVTKTLESVSQDGLSNSASKLVPARTVFLVTRIGLGKVSIIDINVAINQDIKALFPCPDVLPEFLFWSLRAKGPTLAAMGVGATVKGITLQDVRELEIAFPPLSEQRRIMPILNRTATIEGLRSRAQELLREFVPAQIVKMFGDPVENSMGWHIAELGEVGALECGRSRHRPRNAPELYGGSYPFVQTGDVANAEGLIRRASQSYSEAGLRQSKMWPEGTLCITIAANSGKDWYLGVRRLLLQQRCWLRAQRLGDCGVRVDCARSYADSHRGRRADGCPAQHQSSGSAGTADSRTTRLTSRAFC